MSRHLLTLLAVRRRNAAKLGAAIRARRTTCTACGRRGERGEFGNGNSDDKNLPVRLLCDPCWCKENE